MSIIRLKASDAVVIDFLKTVLEITGLLSPYM